MSLIPHSKHKEFTRFLSISELLVETVNANHFGLNSLEEKYARIKPSKKEIESTLKYVSCFPGYLKNDNTALSFLSSEFAHVGITFVKNTDPYKSVNYPKSGVMYGECDTETGLVYIYVNTTFVNILCKGELITQAEFTQLTDDIYDQLAHEMTHRHQVNKSKIQLINKLPAHLDKDDSELTRDEYREKILLYLSRTEEMDAFARQLAIRLSRDTNYDTAVKWMETNDSNLLKYPMYVTYWKHIGIIAVNYEQTVKQDPSIANDKKVQLARETWPLFLQRVMCFLLSINRNHFKGISPRIKGPDRLPK